MTGSKNSRMQQYLNHRVRIQLQDNRNIEGTMKGFDQHMNLVLADCEEFRTIKKGEVKRVLGFILLRGEHVVSMSIRGPPPQEDARNVPKPIAIQPGVPGVSMGHTRGLPAPVIPMVPPRF